MFTWLKMHLVNGGTTAQGCARDLLSRDRDETHVSETETFKILSKTTPRRDVFF